MNIRFVLFVCLLVSQTADAYAQTENSPWSEKSTTLGIIKSTPSGVLDHSELNKLIDVGAKLFTTKFNILDGAGRPKSTQAIIPTKPRRGETKNFTRTSGPDSNACSSCHIDPVIGGAGDFVTNVFLSEGFVNASFDTTDPQFSNERGTNHLFGAGLLELLAREMSVELQEQRSNALIDAAKTKKKKRIQLITKGVKFGFLTAFPDGLVDLSEVEGVDSDLVLRPFSQKGVMTSIRQFTINALNHHHGMQASERFGKRWTNSDDFDEDKISSEITQADVSALVAWQASLPFPEQKKPTQSAWLEAANKGAVLFEDMGCAACHMKSLPLNSLEFRDPGPLDVSGTLNHSQVKEAAVYNLALLDWAKRLPRNSEGDYLVPLFGDLKRHDMSDAEVDQISNELLSQRFVDRNTFITSELWGVASTAPYGHRNDFTTLNEIVLAHGGEARRSRDLYKETDDPSRSAIIAYLKTMIIKP